MMKFASPLSCLVIFALIVQNHSISEKRLCVDVKCVGVISLGKTIKNYSPNQEGVLPFKVDSEVKIKSKSSDSQLLGVEIDGKDGYAPKMFIQEYKVFHKKGALVEGIPEIPPPIQDKSKLKGSQKPSPPLEVTTTAPLPDEVATEKIVAEVGENVEETVNVSPSQTVTVVDGTQIPLDVDVEKKTPEVITEVVDDEGIEPDMEDDTEDDEDDEEDAEDEEYDGIIKEEDIRRVRDSKPVLTKEELIAANNELIKKNAGWKFDTTGYSKEMIEIHNILFSDEIESNETAESVSAANNGGEVIAESLSSVKDNPAEVVSQTNDVASAATIAETVNEVNETAPVLNDVDKQNQTENPPHNAGIEVLKAETMEEVSPGSNEVLENTANAALAQESNEAPISNEEAPTIQEKDGVNKEDAQTVKEEAPTTREEVPIVQEETSTIKEEAPTGKDEIPTLKLEVPTTEEEAPATIDEPHPTKEEAPATIEPQLTKEEAPATIEELQPTKEEELLLTKAESPATIEEPITKEEKPVPIEESQLTKEQAPPTIEEAPKENSSITEQAQTILESQPTEVPHADYATNIEAETVTVNGPAEVPPLNHATTLDTETAAEQPAITNPSDKPELKEEISQAVSQDADTNDVVASELPPVTLNELLKSANTRTLNNDLPPEYEDVTKVPSLTEPGIDAPSNEPFEFDVTTPNPVQPVTEITPPKVPQPPQQQMGLFQTILGTVKGLLPSQEPPQPQTEFSEELDRILYPNKETHHGPKTEQTEEEYCERDVDCSRNDRVSYHDDKHEDEDFIESLSHKVLEIFDVLACMAISAAATLLFTFGYYCLAQCRKENQLIAKLNVVERSLLASNKEASILKHDLGETCDKLASIENNSFGSNDMVIAIKKELELCEESKARLEDQVVSLEKELENAAEAGLELNKIVSELLNNQSGDESIISSVEELQRQLNEQQHTILEINAILADKSRENSELQLILAEQNAKFGGEIASLQQDNDELEAEKNVLKSKLDEMKTEFEQDITKALEGKNAEIKRLQADIVGLRTKAEEEHRKWQTSVAKVEALEECLKTVKRDPSVKVSQIIDVANVQAELLDTQRQKVSLEEKLEFEMDTRKLLEDQVKNFSEEAEKLKHSFHQSEKDKLEAQTRLEVLSNYFKDKENQLQKELSLKEAMWLKQQGETTSTVDRVTNMQEEIQTLRSQNDSLRAEIEAQLAAHKAQIGTLENRAHETWLAARQSERRYEEARSDATALRRKLTSLVGGGNTHTLAKENNLDLNHAPADLNNAPSPVHMESPGSPILGRIPPPPFLGPPFMGAPLPPHFMGIPPFMPPEMRPPPMGRLMSPPPPPGAPHMHRYSPIDDDDDDDEIREGRGHWRDSYSPPRDSYRYSPDRYMYNPELISNYDTETDFSPPPSPRERSHRSGSRSGSYKAYSPPPQSANSQSMDRPKKSSKGQMSSGSEKSYNSWKGKSKAMV